MAAPLETPRARARAAVIVEIKAAARAQLEARGAAALSVRHIARELGMSSSGMYRYFASRDDLLTALIIDAYDALGSCVERAEEAIDREDLFARWQAATAAVRSWARANPQEYGLVFGSPVPGYAAPQDTVVPAARVPLVLAAILRDAYGRRPNAGEGARLAPGVINPTLVASAAPLEGLPDDVVLDGLMAWVALFGLVSFELFGHLVGSADDGDTFFAAGIERIAATMGIPRHT